MFFPHTGRSNERRVVGEIKKLEGQLVDAGLMPDD